MRKAEYITVSKADPRYLQLLEGISEDGRTALPLKSFSAKKSSNWATFRLVSEEKEPRPSRVVVILKGIRPLYLTMTLTSPFLCMAEMARSQVLPDLFLAVSILLSLAFLHFSLFLFNDYTDHIDEVDHTQSKRKRGIIQMGWATAREVKAWAFVNFALGCIFAVPAFVHRPLFVLGMGAIVVFTFLTVWKLHAFLGKRGLNEYVVSLSLGPLLAFGFSHAVYGSFSWYSLSLCVVFGWLASLVFQTKYLEEMVSTYQNKRESLIARLGFDKSKRFITYQLVGLPLLAVAIDLLFSQLWASLFVTLALLTYSYYVVKKFKNSPSPMSSNLVHISRQTALMHLGMGLVTTLILLIPQ
ncbi:MAG: prenyltransferase [Pseudomonadota bacterium]